VTPKDPFIELSEKLRSKMAEKIEGLEATIERVKVLPHTWRLLDVGDMGLDADTLNHCADALEEALRGGDSAQKGEDKN